VSHSGSRILDPVIKGVEPLFREENKSASFGAKVAAPSLNGVDLSFMNISGWDPTCIPNWLLHDTLNV
jgi:hypothetical protein